MKGYYSLEIKQFASVPFKLPVPKIVHMTKKPCALT